MEYVSGTIISIAMGRYVTINLIAMKMGEAMDSTIYLRG